MASIGKTLILFGVVIIAAGIFLQLAHRIPWLGKLPGDILIQKKNFTVYFPITTSIVISIILSLVFWLWSRR
ncbi:MAG: DUF2905 domain-containing protein [Candidatus Omnitrophota bacterium]|jgi:uncharacterized protein HemY